MRHSRLEQEFSGWHRDVARVVGALSVAIARRRVRPGLLRDWADTLEKIAKEMRRADGNS